MIDTSWAPPLHDEVLLLPAGCQWDAVRTASAVAKWAFQILDGTESCAAIIDERMACAYWLVPAGDTSAYVHWERLRGHVAVLGAGPGTHYVGVPPTHHRAGPGLHWRFPADWSGRYLAHPYYLGAVLASAVRIAYGPDAVIAQCPLCERELERADAVTVSGRSGPADSTPRTLEVHPACARTARLRAHQPPPR
ncbi:hypothetical protein [Streptomyces buecherae]|uniref:hypothetical protein n=1 Tax=Streptomyces buecherae TaxID=2763006 RepID=UPI00365A734C